VRGALSAERQLERKYKESIMGNGSFTMTDVPGPRVAAEIAILKLDFRVVTKEPQGNDLWTLRATDRKADGEDRPAAARPGNAGAAAPGAAGGVGGAAQPMNDVETLARTLWGEGRGGSDAGLEAIATVVMNRLAAPDRRFGRTVAQVCRQPKQFSCWNEDDPNRAKIFALKGDEPSLVRCRAVAERAIAGTLADQTFGADHYHQRGMMPVWARGKQASARIDDHLFYNNVA
jgi:N-acetylmuramoyl-L-alanine amidase